jgi:hypothetical protein
MKAVIYISIVALGMLSFTSAAQEADSTKKWKFNGEAGLNFSQLSLTNWNAGGLSSVALNGLLKYNANYAFKASTWDNNFEAGYGFIRRDGERTIKSDDRLVISSQYNKKWLKKNWSYSALLNFNTQFIDGYNYPNESVAISGFLAPAYMIYSAGISYKPSDNFSVMVSPITGKTTIVNDTALSAVGAFGVEAGDKIRSEFGAYLKGMYKVTLMENINLDTKLTLFSNYLNNPQNIDVNWQTSISMKVNSLFSVSISTELIYDDDIAIAVDSNDDGITDATGPRIQFKELLGVGISYKF